MKNNDIVLGCGWPWSHLQSKCSMVHNKVFRTVGALDMNVFFRSAYKTEYMYYLGIHLLPPVKEGNIFSRVCPSVILSTGRWSHLSITHHALDVTKQNPPPPPAVIRPGDPTLPPPPRHQTWDPTLPPPPTSDLGPYSPSPPDIRPGTLLSLPPPTSDLGPYSPSPPEIRPGTLRSLPPRHQTSDSHNPAPCK